MIREQDLLEAIAECQGQRNPNANTCIKLAAFYTILDHLNEEKQLPDQREVRTEDYSFYSPVPEKVGWQSETEFGQMVSDLDSYDVWPVMDELMSTVQALHPKLYDGVMRKLDGLK